MEPEAFGGDNAALSPPNAPVKHLKRLHAHVPYFKCLTGDTYFSAGFMYLFAYMNLKHRVLPSTRPFETRRKLS